MSSSVSNVILKNYFTICNNYFVQWDGVVGRWSYASKELMDLEDNEQDDSVFYGENKKPQTLRRSLRIALKRQKERIPNRTPSNQ